MLIHKNYKIITLWRILLPILPLVFKAYFIFFLNLIQDFLINKLFSKFGLLKQKIRKI